MLTVIRPARTEYQCHDLFTYAHSTSTWSVCFCGAIQSVPCGRALDKATEAPKSTEIMQIFGGPSGRTIERNEKECANCFWMDIVFAHCVCECVPVINDIYVSARHWTIHGAFCGRQFVSFAHVGAPQYICHYTRTAHTQQNINRRSVQPSFAQFR